MPDALRSGTGAGSTPATGRLAGRLLEADDVAAYLGMRTDWVCREVRAGRLPHIRLGRAIRFRQESIDAWIRANEQGARSWRSR